MPTRPKRARFNTKKSTTGWFDLPLEMREMVIDRMDPKTRCTFTKCSKLCEIEAKASKDYMNEIIINKREHPELVISHNECFIGDYCLEFVDIRNLIEPQSIVVYKTRIRPDMPYFGLKGTKGILKWMKIEPGNAEDVRMEYVKKYLTTYAKPIKVFDIDDEAFGIDKLKLKHLKNLREIKAFSPTDFLEADILTLPQILRIEFVDLDKTKLSFEQVLKFEGSVLMIKSDEFGVENINKYLKMWKNGEINENVRKLNVFYEDRYVDRDDIIDGLDVYDFKERVSDEWTFRFDFNYQREGNCYSEVSYNYFCFGVEIKWNLV